MTKYFERIVDINTGAETIRDYTVAEVAEVELAIIEAAERVVEAQAQALARASALAKLAALGLTADEIAAL